MACCSIIIEGPINWWSFSAKYWGPGPGAFNIDVPGTVHWMSQQSTDTPDSIHNSLPLSTVRTVSGIVFQSLTVASIRGHRLKLPLRFFAWQNLDNFLQRHLN